MKYCRDCRKQVRDYELYCPRCSADLYAKPRVRPTSWLDSLRQFKVRAN